ncbi:MAG: ADP-dependent glucokinase/phosphofructokinase [Lachnospiraceae bacterium]|jgi:ADP-dependent phosphofructokinase/glucokinase|nr:ADP-dependent glucokinase/phosphofructokinase [Lachnospiraceae bacterium]
MEKSFTEKYAGAFQSLEQNIAKRRSNHVLTAMGFTSNLDLLCDFSTSRLNSLLDEFLSGEHLSEFKSVSCIHSMEDLLHTICYFCMNGIGGEVDVENTEIIRQAFHFKNGMGGTAVQAALALSELGAESLVHLTDDSKEVCALLDTSNIFVVNHDILTHTGNLQQTHEQELHFIIQFRKGEVIRLGSEEVTIPTSNRLILTKNTVNKTVPLSEEYFGWIERNAKRVSSIVLSSFNCILEPEILLNRIHRVQQHVQQYKASNPSGIVYYEDAHYHDKIVRRMVLDNLYPCVDIVGMNEEELRYTLDQMYSLNIDTDNILDCIDGIHILLNKFRIQKGIIVHTKDYAMYVGRPLGADIESGLMYGNILATAKAKNGWYGTPEQVKAVLGLEMSAKGLENRAVIEKNTYNEEVVLVPSRYIDKPKYTIGLGDSFVGGLQMCF